jgi:uncharacterized membrane protein
MNQLIVVGFDHVEDARRALESLRGLERSGGIRLEDTALVERDDAGTPLVHNEVSGTTEKATAIGAVVGGLVTFMFPLAGATLGAAAGAALGRMFHSGVSGSFVDEVKATLQPGRSALFLVVRGADADAVRGALKPFSGEVIQSTLDSEAEEALRQALA